MTDDEARSRQPASLGSHIVPQERRQLIEAHVAMLSETARTVSDGLSFAADVSELSGVLEAATDTFGSGDAE